ncbi:MAG: YgiQ family radical SAM protein [Eubacteriaceae bacterium]|nr:YgiQ family radical SAM protein [Eubacteriaceae bacterium]
MIRDFLPVTKKDMEKRGWDECDFVFVTGDAYVDHSSFGMALLSRLLESRGFKVGIIAQPDWKDPSSVTVLGRPKYAFLISSGNMDSMVNHYTVNKKKRSSDRYSPGGKAGKRPDYALTVYCNLVKGAYKDIPVIVGGIEASLRRLAHYDYWSERFRRSVLMDSGADLLVYGMGEKALVEIAECFKSGLSVKDMTFIRGTVYKARDVGDIPDAVILPDYESMLSDRKKYAESFGIQYKNTDSITAKVLSECYGSSRYIVQNPPQHPLTTQEMDDIYELPYMNNYHPMYEAAGGIPTLDEVKFSLTSNRGCFGSCSFCSLAFHEGRVVQARSHESLVREASKMSQDPAFKGYIHDVGGPTANFRRPACDKQLTKGVCSHRQCLFPKPCKNLIADHSDYVELLRKLRSVPGVKKVFIRSGIRFDYVMADKDDTFLRELCRYHISGQLRVAPEHVSDEVLELMGKPSNRVFNDFVKRYEKINASTGKKQYIVSYLISSHPGSTLKDAVALAEMVRDMGYMPEQVQDFYPTPSTVSTVMYYTGYDPRNMKKVYTATSAHEKAMQRALIQYRKPENYDLVREALVKTGRTDLIGFDRKVCLIPPRKTGEKKPSEGREGRPSGASRKRPGSAPGKRGTDAKKRSR